MHPVKRRPIRLWVFGAAILVLLGIWPFRSALQDWIIARETLASDAPSAELLERFIQNASEPSAAILAAWNSGKIVHREFAMRRLSGMPGTLVRPELERILQEGALDPDQNVREAAMSGLHNRHGPAMIALAAAQLRDADPQIRLLGLDYVRYAAAADGVSLVAPLMDDADLRVAGRAIKLLENWTQQNFGIKLADTVQVDDPRTGLKTFRNEGVARTRAAGARAREWWSQHASDFPTKSLEQLQDPRAGLGSIPAGDFKLPDLEGHTVRLTDFRGKVVMINFWTTWCVACLAEIPELVELQRRHGDRLVILGISLDCVPDNHGHLDPDLLGAEADAEPLDRDVGRAMGTIRAGVARVVKKLGINYTVLLDADNRVGGRFNGGELPTTVIVDPYGAICRRFVGARDLNTFEAMLAGPLQGSSQPDQ